MEAFTALAAALIAATSADRTEPATEHAVDGERGQNQTRNLNPAQWSHEPQEGQT